MRNDHGFSRFLPCLALVMGACNDRPVAPAATPAAPAATASPTSDSPHNTAPAANAAAIPFDPPAGGAAQAGATRGVVRETMNAAGYTYLRIETSARSRWIATTEMPVSVGNEVEVTGGNEMPGFHSRTLNRTFEQITFAGMVRVVGASASDHAPAAARATAEPAPAAAPTGGADTSHGVVRETMNSGGYTYLRVDTAGGSRWVAVPQTTVTVGSRVEIAGGNEMPGFHSRTLNRTFDQLTFASGVRVDGSEQPSGTVGAPTSLPPGHPAIDHGAAPATPETTPSALPPGHPAVGPTA